MSSQKKPSWAQVYSAYPKDYRKGFEDDIPSAEVYASIFTNQALEKLRQQNIDLSNACAARVSLGLLNAGILVRKDFLIDKGNFKGKGLITSASSMATWLKSVLGEPLTISNSQNLSNIEKIRAIIGNKKGIYLMIPKSPKDFGASGHVSLWHNGDAIGRKNYHASAKIIYFWELK